MEPSVICGSLKLARSIAEFAGLIETIGTKIDRLAKAEFEAGFRALEQAAISSSEKDSLLREARYRFNKAISLEKEERLFLCHVGLAICHKELCDSSNFKLSLLQACEVQIYSAIQKVFNITNSETMKKVMTNEIASIVTTGLLAYPIGLATLYSIYKSDEMKSRRASLENEQKKIREYLSKIET